MQHFSEEPGQGAGIPDETLLWPKGFTSATYCCGLKESGNPDLALLASQHPATAAAVFTQNVFKAAPIIVSQEHLRKSKKVKGLIINSGNANAGTGSEGILHAQAMTTALAAKLECPPEQTLVMSTGVIGKKLPIAPIQKAIREADFASSQGSVLDFCKAIMTTDTRPKAAWSVTPELSVVGIAKGSGMIHPNMATMLAVIVTNATIPAPQLAEALSRAVEQSFHCISVDGATSTNDCVAVMANGCEAEETNLEQFEKSLTWICCALARQIVEDGEGASKIIEITVEKGRTESECVQIAKAIAGSLLVKTAFFGEDPNWGRILAAAGQAGVAFELANVDVYLGSIALILQGEPASFSHYQLKLLMQARTIGVTMVLHQGSARGTVWTNDLSYRYVEINAEYST